MSNFLSVLLALLLVVCRYEIVAQPVLSAANPAQQIQFVYFCKPIHYLSTYVEWQRIDSGLYISSSTAAVASVTVWIDDFDPTSDALSMLGSDCKYPK